MVFHHHSRTDESDHDALDLNGGEGRVVRTVEGSRGVGVDAAATSRQRREENDKSNAG
jgi:hypothetical protein